jgi:hypothetical protein
MSEPAFQNETDWRTIIRRIKTGKCTPIISSQVSGHHFTEQDHIIEEWANHLRYPIHNEYSDLPRVAQYATVTGRDILAAKEGYLDFLKERLLKKARGQPGPEPNDFLDTLEDELIDLAFSTVAARLGYPAYENELDNPLRILAELPIPLYITSDYCTFIEEALKTAGKAPRTEICYWHEDLLDDVPSVFEEDPDYVPSETEPLVYHFHGLDTCPSSLVVSEDDYLDFLVNISQDSEAIPRRVAQALTDSSLLLLGYQLRGWDFRVIFRGLITSKRASRRLLSVSIQLSPEAEDVKDAAAASAYFKQYFGNLNFDIYWGDTQSFLKELWAQWQS